MGKEPALPKNIRQIGEIQGQEKVCLEDYVMTCIHKKEEQEKEGWLGVFLGELQTGEEAQYVFVRGLLEFPTKVEEENLAEYLERQRQKYFPDWEVQGCCVIGPYPTGQLKTASELLPGFNRLVYHLQEQEETLYWNSEETCKKLKGYVVFYEQNRKMQQYLEDCFGEKSVEKESAPDKAIKSFREKVREKSVQKKSSMLKLASSFFVVTMLAIGAIAVTRLDDIRTLRQNIGREGRTDENEILTAQEPINDPVLTTQEPAVDATQNISESVENSVEDSTVDAAQSVEEPIEDSAPPVEEPAVDVAQPVEEPEADAAQSVESGTLAGLGDTQNPEQISQNATGGATEAAVRKSVASYTIKEGDTLAEICSRYYGGTDKLSELCEANGIADANKIMPGQKIVLP